MRAIRTTADPPFKRTIDDITSAWNSLLIGDAASVGGFLGESQVRDAVDALQECAYRVRQHS